MNARAASRTAQRARRASAWTPVVGIRVTPCAVRTCRRQGGFTLLEVIAAIMLLAIAFGALMTVAGASIALTQNAATRSAAAMWARSKLDSEFVTTPLQVGRSVGQFDRQFSWQLDVIPWANAGTAAVGSSRRMYELDLKVSWGSLSRPRSAHFRTLRLATMQPAAGSAAEQQP